tara:strand:+ start:773 stop:1285 length:513 start_codon:yes stop_codon:yes gene_type:complete
MIIKNGSQKIKFKFKLSFIILFFFTSNVHSQNIDIAPLINLDELVPSYDEDVIDSRTIEDTNEDSFIKSKNDNYEYSFATISLLNKITAEVKTIKIKLKENSSYEELRIYAIDCYNSKPFEKKETAVYLNIYNQASQKKIFNGWMIKSLPSVSSMEHPVYDIWVDECNKL